MQVKLIGGLILFACAIFYAKFLKGNLHKRLNELNEINILINDFLISINVGLYEIIPLIEDEIPRLKTSVKQFLMLVLDKLKSKNNGDFYEIWCSSLEEISFNVTSEELDYLRYVGKNITYQDKDRISRQLNLIKLKFEEIYKFSSMEIRKKSKMYEKLGVLIGAFLVVLVV